MQLRVASLSVAPIDFGANPPFNQVVEVDRRRRPYLAIQASAVDHQAVDMLAANTVPLRPVREEVVNMTFFQLDEDQYGPNGLLDLSKVLDAYAELGLDPDPIAQAAVNETNKGFTVAYPNMSVWLQPYGSRGERVYLQYDSQADLFANHSRVCLKFDRGNVLVDQSFWFGGVPKSPRPFVLPPRG